MSYIINTNSPFVSIKLTEKGREKLSMGKLNFSYWAIGDSEINYEREAIVDANPNDVTLSASSKVLRPFDRQPNIKYFISPNNSATPYQPINSSNLSVVKAVVNNEATERGFFSGASSNTTILTSGYTSNNQLIPNSNLSGSTSLTLTGSVSNISVGDVILLRLSNGTTGSIAGSNTTTPIPNLWYKVQSISGSTLVLDRNLPNYSGDSASSYIIAYKGGEVYDTIATGNTTSYWDSGTLSFNSSVNVTCHDVPVWNMNNVWCESLAGMVTGDPTPNEQYTSFGSYPYLGTKNPYLEYLCDSSGNTETFNCNGPGISYPDDVSKSVSIIHFTNNSISNLYGEFLYVDATNNKIVKVIMPDLMYHRRNFSTGSGTTMGMTFIASGATKYIGTSDIEYIDLIEEPSLISSTGATPMVVGKVLPQLKMIVIHDDEIVSAISYKSNRNWTLPNLAANIVSPSGGTSTGVLLSNQTIYLTYILENSLSTGLTTSLPCQNYVKVTNNTPSAKDIQFRINQVDELPYMRKKELVGYDGLGFYADKFKLVYQIVSASTTRPDPNAWKVYDYTSTAITTNSGETINPVSLENQNPLTNDFVLTKGRDTASSQFNLINILNMPNTNQPSLLQFGDERFFYGNIQTYIGASIYKTIFDIRVDSNVFNTTTNPTRSKDLTTNPATIRLTEVGVYDSDFNLVCIGKVSNPVKLIPANTIMLELSMDF
jgi:hypothetical protein